MDVNRQLSHFFKSKPELDRLLKLMKAKYESLGAVGGSVRLNKPTDEERAFLRGLLKKDFTTQKTITISLKKFEEAFSGTAYNGAELLVVLKLYFDGKLTTKEESRVEEERRWHSYFEECLANIQNKRVAEWLKATLTDKKSGSYKWLVVRYREDAMVLKQELKQLSQLITLTELSENPIVLPVAAAKITKDPHGLDPERNLFKGLLYCLAYRENVDFPSNAEERSLLLELGNVLTNAVNQFVITYGLIGYDSKKKTKNWESFYKHKEPLTLSGMNLTNLSRVQLTEGNSLFCFENPAVFYEFIVNRSDKPALCSNGQINQSLYKLFDYLQKESVTIYYHGDYDPEGLLIAERLINRFKNIQLVLYDREHYYKAMSNKTISERRLKQLDKIKDSLLKEVAELIKLERKAGYQEYMIDDILRY